MRDRTRAEVAPAVVMGDADLVRPLALAGIRSAVFAQPHAAVRLSRYVTERLRWHDAWREPDAVAGVLLAYARTAPERPVVYPQTDGDLVAVSRNRDRLAEGLRMLLAREEVVEASVDKAAFAELAARLELPVPRAQRLDPRVSGPADLELRPPIVVKPLLRDAGRWRRVENAAKACHVASARELEALWERIAAADLPVLAQEAIPGAETRIESYHAYVDATGDVVAAFTGRKIRTRPTRYGHSSAVEITAEPDVAALGREVVERIGVAGVVKADFKRDDGGRLWLLEINPRFTLWHHPAAVAGLNIPAIVHADLTGAPRPAFGPARPGVRWCLPLLDVRAARRQGVGLGAWLRFLRGCEAISGAAVDDPFPFIPGAFWEPLSRRVEALR